MALKKAGITHCIFNHHFLYDTTDRYDHQGSPQVPVPGPRSRTRFPLTQERVLSHRKDSDKILSFFKSMKCDRAFFIQRAMEAECISA